MEMVERVARTLCRDDGNPENTIFGGKAMWRSYENTARLVIDCMREPTFEMLSLPETDWKDAVVVWNTMSEERSMTLA
jgi:hypothetical protein